MSDKNEPMRRYSFQLTRDDWAAFVHEVAAAPDKLAYVLGAMFFLIGMVWAILRDLEFTTLGRLLVICAAVAIAYALAKLFRKALDWRKIRAKKIPPLPTLVEEFVDHLAVVQDDIRTTYAWDKFARIHLGKDHVFLALSPKDCVIMPLRAFRDRDDMQQFCQLAEARCQDPRDAANDDEDAAYHPPAEALSVNFTISPLDMTHLRADSRKVTRVEHMTLPKAALFTTIVGGISTGGLSTFWARSGEWDFTLWAAFAWPGAVLLTWIGALRIAAVQKQVWQHQDSFAEQRQFTIDAAGLHVQGKNFNTHINWDGIDDIIDGETQLMITTRWKEIFAVPKHAFTVDPTSFAFYLAASAWKIDAMAAQRESQNVKSAS